MENTQNHKIGRNGICC